MHFHARFTALIHSTTSVRAHLENKLPIYGRVFGRSDRMDSPLICSRSLTRPAILYNSLTVIQRRPWKMHRRSYFDSFCFVLFFFLFCFVSVLVFVFTSSLWLSATVRDSWFFASATFQKVSRKRETWGGCVWWFLWGGFGDHYLFNNTTDNYDNNNDDKNDYDKGNDNDIDADGGYGNNTLAFNVTTSTSEYFILHSEKKFIFLRNSALENFVHKWKM